MFQKVQLLGRLGKDPVLKYTQQGVAVLNMDIATDERFMKEGEKVQKTEWHKVVVFRKLAEICKQHLKKGSMVFIEGKLNTRPWEKDGETRYSTSIMANMVLFVDSKHIDEALYDDMDVPF